MLDSEVCRQTKNLAAILACSDFDNWDMAH